MGGGAPAVSRCTSLSGPSVTRSWRHPTVSTATSTSCSSCATPSTTSWPPGRVGSTGERTCVSARLTRPLLRSETVCYLVVVLNHMVSASCLTLVLPVLVFLWATLSVPRPSKTFWMTAIVYTEVLACLSARLSVCLSAPSVCSPVCLPPVCLLPRLHPSPHLSSLSSGHHRHQVLLPVWVFPL